MKVLLLVLSLGFASICLAQQPSQKIYRYSGSDISIEGPREATEFGSFTFGKGTIWLKDREYKIFVKSRYGNIGAFYVGNNEEIQEFLYFTSSFINDLVEVEDNLPWMAADDYTDCQHTAYNTVAVVYDVTGVDVRDARGNSLDLSNPTDLRRKLFPALSASTENSNSAHGYCRTIRLEE